MANQHGYAVIQTDVPGLWTINGYVPVGATGAPNFAGVPSGVVSSITRTGVGAYTLTLAQPWYACLFVAIHSEIPTPLTPAIVSVQIQNNTIGTSATPTITIQFHVSTVATELPSGSGFRFQLMLKQSSA